MAAELKYVIVPINGIGTLTFDHMDDALGGAKTLLEDSMCPGVIINKQMVEQDESEETSHGAAPIDIRISPGDRRAKG